MKVRVCVFDVVATAEKFVVSLLTSNDNLRGSWNIVGGAEYKRRRQLGIFTFDFKPAGYTGHRVFV